MPYSRRRRVTYGRRRRRQRTSYAAVRARRYSFRNRRSRSKRFNRPSQVRFRQLTFPDEVFTKLRYHTQYTISGIATSNQYWILRGNSLYDPDLTYVGHQPTGFDQFSAMYAKYMVYGSKIRVTVQQNQTGTTSNFYLIPYADTSAPSWLGATTNDPIEQPYAKHRMVPGYTVANGQPASFFNMKHYMTTKKMYGVKGELDQVTYAGDTGNTGVGTTPVGSWIWILYTTVFNFSEGTGVNANLSLTLDVKITYYSKFYKRVMLNSS